MIPLDDAIESTLRRLGLGEPAVMMSISREWGSVAGESWAEKSTPLYLKDGVLVVEAADRRAVAFLRYGTTELQRRLVDRFGSETIRGVDVRPPTRDPRRVT